MGIPPAVGDCGTQVIMHATRGEVAIELWAKAHQRAPAILSRLAGVPQGRAELRAVGDGGLLRRALVPPGAAFRGVWLSID